MINLYVGFKKILLITVFLLSVIFGDYCFSADLKQQYHEMMKKKAQNDFVPKFESPKNDLKDISLSIGSIKIGDDVDNAILSLDNILKESFEKNSDNRVIRFSLDTKGEAIRYLIVYNHDNKIIYLSKSTNFFDNGKVSLEDFYLNILSKYGQASWIEDHGASSGSGTVSYFYDFGRNSKFYSAKQQFKISFSNTSCGDNFIPFSIDSAITPNKFLSTCGVSMRVDSKVKYGDVVTAYAVTLADGAGLYDSALIDQKKRQESKDMMRQIEKNSLEEKKLDL